MRVRVKPRVVEGHLSSSRTPTFPFGSRRRAGRLRFSGDLGAELVDAIIDLVRSDLRGIFQPAPP